MMDLASILDTRGRHGSSAAHLLLGWVTGSSGTVVGVRLPDGTQVDVPRLRSYAAPAVNDVVILAKAGAALYCLGAFNAGPVPPGAPAGDPEPERHDIITQTFRPTSTGTWREADGGYWRADTTNLVQGDQTGEGLNTGAAYYGAAPSSVGAVTPVSGSVRVRRQPGGTPSVQAPTLHLLAEEERPTGAPVSVDTMPGPGLIPGQEADVALPLEWLTALLNGSAGGLGIGVPGLEPYLVLAGTSAWAPAFEFTAQWRS